MNAEWNERRAGAEDSCPRARPRCWPRLSYREFSLLGRALTIDEAREVTNMARRIAAIVALEAALDDNYRTVKDHAYLWRPSETMHN